MIGRNWVAVSLIGLAASVLAHAQTVAVPPVKQKPKAGATKVEFISVEELKAKMLKNEPVVIVDVRSQNAYLGSDKKIRGAVHTKSRKIAWRLRMIPRDQEVVVYCACSGDEASIRGAQTLFSAGFTRVRVLKGGWQAWLAAGGPLESKPVGS